MVVLFSDTYKDHVVRTATCGCVSCYVRLCCSLIPIQIVLLRVVCCLLIPIKIM